MEITKKLIDSSKVSVIRDGVGVDGITILVSTPFDVINKYGEGYKYNEVTDECFEMEYPEIGMTFFCGYYDYVSSESLHKNYVIEIYIYSRSSVVNSKNIILNSSTIGDLLHAYGTPESKTSFGQKGDKISLNYPGVKFIVPNEKVIVPWRIEEFLSVAIESFVICYSDEGREALHERIRVDRWAAFVPFMTRNGWGLTADGMLHYEKRQFYFGSELSKYRFSQTDLEYIYDCLFIFYREKSVKDPEVNVDYCIYLNFKCEQALGIALEEFFENEVVQYKNEKEIIARTLKLGDQGVDQEK